MCLLILLITYNLQLINYKLQNNIDIKHYRLQFILLNRISILSFLSTTSPLRS
jgi:hypothetical protein